MRSEATTVRYDGVFALIVLNVLLFALDRLGVPLVRRFYLAHDNAALYQYLTSLFMHANWQHLSGNLFFLYIFGRLVEEREGTFGVVFTYLVCGLGANVVSNIFLTGSGYSLGASGAVFGLFSVSVLIRLSWHWRRLLEVVILGQFVVSQFWMEARRIGAEDQVGHLTHVAGAIIGALLVFGLSRLVARAPKAGVA